MHLFFLAFVILLGIVGSLSCIRKQEAEAEQGLKASDFEIIEVKDKEY